LAVLLCFAVVSSWVPERWAWSLFQIGIFLLAGWYLIWRRPLSFRAAYLPLAAAAAWPVVQLAAGQTVNCGLTWATALDWSTFLFVFLLACESLAEPIARAGFLKAASLSGSVLAVISIAQKFSAAGKIFWLFPSGYS